MSNEFLDKAVWVLIYGGLLVLSAGIFVRRQDTAFGAVLLVLGGLAAVSGAVLLWVRSRRKA